MVFNVLENLCIGFDGMIISELTNILFLTNCDVIEHYDPIKYEYSFINWKFKLILVHLIILNVFDLEDKIFLNE